MVAVPASSPLLFRAPPAAINIQPSPLEQLSRVRQAGVNLAVWVRPPKAECLAAIKDLLDVCHPVALDVVPVSLTDLRARIITLAGDSRDEHSAQALAEDVWVLLSLFCEVADTSSARVRLERIEDDGCQLFHADSLRIRMLCTYAGPGTEWLAQDNVRFDQLGLRGRSIEEANRAIVIDEARIQRVAPWHVAVFTGRKREDTLPLVHRSAPVRSREDHRIRLCIDLPDACGC